MATKMVEGTKVNIHVKGSVTGKIWAGDFRIKPLLTFREQMAADRMRREFLGPDAHMADPEMVATATILAELAFRLTETPEWWKEAKGGLDLSDPNIVEEVFKQARQIQSDYVASVEKEGEAAVEAFRKE